MCFFFQEMIIKADEKGNMKEKVDAMQKKYDVSRLGAFTLFYVYLCVSMYVGAF